MKQGIRASVLVGAGLAMGLLLPAAWGAFTSHAQATPSATTNCQSFPQTGHKICGRFFDYWQGHGGLAQQGYPLSEEFTETSDLNGKPYTVQYFERAVFELHSENAAPNDVLLSQLGTFLGKSNYPQGFTSTSGQQPFYEIRSGTGVQALKSYYNAINRKEYERAYSYFEGAPNPPASVAPPFQQFVAGYKDTASVTLAAGKETGDAGAGQVYSSFPVVITSTHTDGSKTAFSGCYVLHHVNEGISPNPNDALWSIQSAKLTQANANTPVDALLGESCSR